MDTNQIKICLFCPEKGPQDISKFGLYKNRKGVMKRRTQCLQCRQSAFKPWSQTPRGRQTSAKANRKVTLRKLGLTQEKYDQMIQEQEGQCKICHQVPQKTLCIDHCHTTGTVRGLLCNRCNFAIGNFKDDIGNMLRAANYLQGDFMEPHRFIPWLEGFLYDKQTLSEADTTTLKQKLEKVKLDIPQPLNPNPWVFPSSLPTWPSTMPQFTSCADKTIVNIKGASDATTPC